MVSSPTTTPPLDCASAPRAKSIANRIGLTLFGLIFLAFGVGFTSLIFHSFSSAIAQRSWSTADAVITRSAIDDNQKPSQPNYRLEVEFTYSVAAHQMTATQVRTDYTGSSDYYDAQKLHDAYPVGIHATCWFDPAHPQNAVLQRSSLLVGFACLIPLPFVAIGVAICYFAWFSSTPTAPKPVQGQRGNNAGKVVFGIFFVVGTALLIFVFTPMIYRDRQAKTWPQVPCTIVHSGVSSHSGNKGGTTYGIEVLYRYQFDGKRYASSKYGFMSSSSSDYSGKQDIVRSLAPRTKTVCFVNPADPAYAVLDRSSGSTLLFGLIALVFAIIGAAGCFGTFRKPVADASTVMPGSMVGALPKQKAPIGPAGKLLQAFCLAAFWNGIVSIFINQLFVEWKHGRHDYFLAVFLVPFVIVGVILIVTVGYCIVKLFD